LTIEPGVTVQFENAAANKLNVSGALSAVGTLTQPITFAGVVAQTPPKSDPGMGRRVV